MESDPDGPYSTDHEWEMEQPAVLSDEWMSGPSAPDDNLEMLSCRCLRQCKVPHCVCLKTGLRCTYMCKLQTCSNQSTGDDALEYFGDVDELDGEVYDKDVEGDMERD